MYRSMRQASTTVLLGGCHKAAVVRRLSGRLGGHQLIRWQLHVEDQKDSTCLISYCLGHDSCDLFLREETLHMRSGRQCLPTHQFLSWVNLAYRISCLPFVSTQVDWLALPRCPWRCVRYHAEVYEAAGCKEACLEEETGIFETSKASFSLSTSAWLYLNNSVFLNCLV